MSTRAERKLQDRLNRICKLAPGLHRIYQLDRLAANLEFEADVADDHDRPHSEVDALLADAVFLRRLAWDLFELRHAARGVPLRQPGMTPGVRP